MTAHVRRPGAVLEEYVRTGTLHGEAGEHVFW